MDLLYECLYHKLAGLGIFDKFFGHLFCILQPVVILDNFMLNLNLFFLNLALTHLLLSISLLLHTLAPLFVLSILVPETVKYHIFNFHPRVILPDLMQVSLSLVSRDYLTYTRSVFCKRLYGCVKAGDRVLLI